MSITSYDHFIEELERVPSDFQRTFDLMVDLDKRNRELIRRINECAGQYRKSTKNKRISLAKETFDLFDKARSYSDDKVDLAAHTYNLVDKHIRRLECIYGPSTIGSETHGTTSNSVGLHNDTNTKDSGISSIAAEPLAVDMPLDPNEPKYCTCHQVSFGEMIACDNKDCPVEWFHFPCVDLKSKPKGKWYCPECFNINKKGKHRLKRQKT